MKKALFLLSAAMALIIIAAVMITSVAHENSGQTAITAEQEQVASAVTQDNENVLIVDLSGQVSGVMVAKESLIENEVVTSRAENTITSDQITEVSMQSHNLVAGMENSQESATTRAENMEAMVTDKTISVSLRTILALAYV